MDLKVKVCGMSNPRNMAKVAQLRPDYMGFIFHASSPRNALSLNPEDMANLPDYVTPVGVFVNRSYTDIIDTCRRYGIATVQLHGDESPSLCLNLKAAGLDVWKAFGIGGDIDWALVEKYCEGAVDRFVFDTKSRLHGGTGKKYDWHLLDSYHMDVPFFLSGGVTPDDATAINGFSHPKLVGVDVNSRFEVSPGCKDISLLNKFFSQLR